MKKKKENENPLHREYGLFSNIRYILRSMIKFDRKLLLLIPLGMICVPAMNYLWTFISKFVIDMITGEKGWESLLYLMAIFTAVQIASTKIGRAHV